MPTDPIPALADPIRFALTTADGLRLRAERTGGDDASAVVVLSHPHPLHGGTMHVPLIEHLFRAAPGLGVAAIRFNFRGVQGSDGRHDHGSRERLDVAAAIAAATEHHPDLPIVLAGWSFGADVSLAVGHPAVAGWFGAAPPLRVIDPTAMVAADDPRPVTLVYGAHDQIRSPAEAATIVGSWTTTTLIELPGADHFFVGAAARVTDHLAEMIATAT